MADRDEFDRIVEHLDLDLSFPDEPERAAQDTTHRHPSDPERTWSRSPDEPTDDGDDAFYRRVDPPDPRPWSRNVILAWVAVVGAPVGLSICSLLGFFVPRSVLAGLALTFIAGSIYLISQLPEHRAGAGDDPDDGAVL